MSVRTFEPDSWHWDQANDIDDGFTFWVGPMGGDTPGQRQVQHVIEWEHGLDPDENPEQFEEAEAIADLIVAGPNLLAACKTLLGMLEDAGAADTAGCDMARKAIAKATPGA